MAFPSSHYAWSDTSSDDDTGEQSILAAVSVARERSGVNGLCEQCEQIIGWFFLDPHVFSASFGVSADSRFKFICNIQVDNYKPTCRLCNYFDAIAPENDIYAKTGHFRLATSTVGSSFGFDPIGSCRFDTSPIFYLAPARSYPKITAPHTGRSNTIFGFSNADPSRDGVAIRRLAEYADLALVRKWIRLCDEDHVDCLSKAGIELEGFRVIDCQRKTLIAGDKSMQYVTLSYVWGSEVSERPDRSGRLPSVLPDLITGVIKVVLDLGYRYLWIDRYCVSQFDSTGIKSLLLRNMDQIYSKSSLTIIAATTTCPSEGLAGITRPRVIKQKALQMKSVQLLQWIHDVRSEIEGSVWNARGWTYQEAVLSGRRLVFTEKQCYFQCRTGSDFGPKEGSHMESIEYDLTTERNGPQRYMIPVVFPPTRKLSPRDNVTVFQDRVNDYIKRHLSRDSDVLPAFLGILGMLTSESPDFHGHINGVPVFEPKSQWLNTDTAGTLITGITWYFKIDFETLDLNTTPVPPRRRVLPSWTWCDWVNELPSLYPIKWELQTLSTRLPRRDMVLDTTLSLELEDGTVLPWPRDSNVRDLMKMAMAMGIVRCLHILGWLTNLSIPDCSSLDHYEYISCGPYSILGWMVLWLRRLAKERKMDLTCNNEYIFKAWVFAPAVPSYDEDLLEPWDIASMMILDETSSLATFERIEVCKVIMGTPEMEDWKGKSVKDTAEVFGLEMKAFTLV